ncbi:MAG: competence protein CoiA family protein [Caldilineaceae bacterium]|nr:competence protein CoiA family protein [Caldilineaceae bacterium]
MKSILHPLAFDSGGRLISVHDAKRGVTYLCVGCKKEMVPRKGKVKRPHFAHKKKGECSDPDEILHKMAQSLIVQSVKDAARTDEKYRVGYVCSMCKKQVAYNIISRMTSIQAEREIVQGTRSDIVIHRKNKCPIIIEVVVTHDLEPETADLYLKSGNPVFSIYPDWDSLDNLKSEIIAHKGINVDIERCPKCKLARENWEKEKGDQMKVAMSKLTKIERRPETNQKMKTWVTDRIGQPLFFHVRKQLYANAMVLLQMGFRQSRKNPSVFWFDLRPLDTCIFADLGWYYHRNDEKIWQQPRIMLDCKTGDYPEDFKPILLNTIFNHCENAGLAAEVFDTGKRTEFSGNNAVELIDKRTLNFLLNDSKRNGHQDSLM